jgi:thiamine kinase-like enzyme
VLNHLPCLRPWVGFLWPTCLLPAVVVFKKEKEGWGREFEQEIEQYRKRADMRGHYLPICYGIGSDHEKRGILLSYCGDRLEEQLEIDEEHLREMLHNTLHDVKKRGLLHRDLNLSNILYDGRQLWIVDLEYAEDSNDWDVEEETKNLMYFYRDLKRRVRQ